MKTDWRAKANSQSSAHVTQSYPHPPFHILSGRSQRWLYRRTEKPRQARERFIPTTTMMREMEMGLWLEKAEAELKELP